MKTETRRQYREVASVIRDMLISGQYAIGERLPPERNFAELLGVGRSVVREALLMLEIEGYVAVRKGSGVYVLDTPEREKSRSNHTLFGPFEILQARQLLESNIAEFAAIQVTPSDIQIMRAALDAERRDLENGVDSEDGDMNFHAAIAQATHNSLLTDLWHQAWVCRNNNPMWQHLHERIAGHEYRKEWLKDHMAILAALQKKDPGAAKRSMWTHIENVKQRLMELSDVDAAEFDGYLFGSYPVSGC
jgi:GntR family uxuAB operon transcriptional repressor